MNILLICPYFLPYSGVGVLRPSSLANYLTNQGEHVTILKMANSCYPSSMCTGTQPSSLAYVEYLTGETEEASAESMGKVLQAVLSAQKMDCCLISCGPFYPLSPTLQICKEFHVPVIVDYRDLWLYNTNPSTSLRAFLGRHYYRIQNHTLEAGIMADCAAFTTCTPQALSIMEQHYPVLRGKTACIYNGYGLPPQDDLSTSAASNPEISLFVMGKFSYYSKGKATMFLRAAKQLLDRGYPIRIVHAGALEPLSPLMKKTGFPEEYFQELGPLSYEKALEAASQSNIAIVISAGKYGLSTKLFDYLYLNKPMVLTVAPSSEMGQLLSGNGNAHFCQTKGQIITALAHLIDNQVDTFTQNQEFRARFFRDHQNSKFHGLMQHVVNQNHGGMQ